MLYKDGIERRDKVVYPSSPSHSALFTHNMFNLERALVGLILFINQASMERVVPLIHGAPLTPRPHAGPLHTYATHMPSLVPPVAHMLYS